VREVERVGSGRGRVKDGRGERESVGDGGGERE